MPAFKIIQLKYAHIVVILIILVTCAPGAFGQSQYDKGTPPQHAAGVSPLGSYTSADLGTVNLSNGSLNIKLPLGSVGGRGFTLPLSLNYSSKVWSASRESSWGDETGNHPVAFAQYAEVMNVNDITSAVAPGWTLGAAPTLIVRGFGIKDHTTSICAGDFRFALTKLTVTLPDKGEIQLRDDTTNGAPLATQNDPSTNCMARDGSRGQRWHATDGSGIVFISDTANGIVRGDLNGVLILSDGTRYRFASSYNPPAGSPPLNIMGGVKILARATSITDRNGNLISITYPAANEIRYTDQLGRVTKIQKGVPDPGNPSVNLPFLITMPGYQGQNRYYKIKTALMNQRYRPGINPITPVINGDYDPLGWGLSWGTATRLFPQSHGLNAERIDTITVMSEFVLPDDRSMEFFYNEFGEIAEVRLPTGGKLQYDYQYVSTLPAGKTHMGEAITVHFESNVSDVDRAVVARRTYPDGSTLEGSWTYSYTNTTAQVTASSASGSVLLNQKHYFMARGRYLNSPPGSGPIPDRGVEGTGYSLWSTGVESRTETLDAAGTSVIAASEEDWTQRTAVSWSAYTTYAQEQPENDNRVNQSRRYLETGAMAKVETFYDQYNNPTEVKEYDYDQTLKRRTVTSYLSLNNGFNYQTDDSIHLLRLLETQTIYDANNNQKAQTVTEYDVYTNDGNRNVLTGYASLSQHDSNYGTSKTTRGNPTRNATWLNTTSSYIYFYPRYDIVGNVVSAKDPRGNVSTVSFADDFGDGSNPGTPTQNPGTPTYALPTLFTSPPPSAGAPVHTARSQYDYSSGLLTGFRDRNNIVSQTIYNDPFNRPTQVKSALGVTGVETHVTNYYAPATVSGITLAKNDVLTVSDLNTVDDGNLRSWTVTDGFGRTTEAWKRDPLGDVKVVTIYDGLGRIKQTSNPFRAATESAVYTTTVYDLAGRITSVTTPDGAPVTTNYVANTATATDPAGKARKSVTDALGRLIEVYEDPNGLNYQTTYNYDVLGNLTTVTQGTQTRTFVYDSLKRLRSTTNPESGTITYDYDNNSNLTVKTDARGIVTTNVYDALNRVTTILYRINGQPDPNTGDVEYLYDNATNGKGRLWLTYKWGAKPSHTAVGYYDALGRVKQLWNLFGDGQGGWSAGYEVNRNYDLAGNVTSQTYPSGHTVTYSYDVASRTSGMSGTLGDGVSRSYASSFIYNARNQLTQELFGTETPLYHKLQYNIRGQLWDVRVSTNPDVNGSFNRGALQYFYDGSLGYGTSGPDNNGNVRFENIYTPTDEQGTGWAIHRHNYTYDSLNRLSSVQEYFISNYQAESQQSLQSYTYDRWGNRAINPASWGTGINTKQFTIDTATNRLGVPAGQSGTMTYDNAGNLTTDTYTGAGARTYDAENRIVSAADNTGQVSSYTYNANSQRVRRQIASSQEEWQIYGIDGELVAEYRAWSPVSAPDKEYGYRNGQLLVQIGANMVWSDDTVPAGAAVGGDSEGWNWVSSSPGPFSGSLSHQSNIVAGLHQHYFYGATATLSVNAGDKLIAYVYIDPGNVPSQIMLQWGDANWEHRAYWGANNIPWGVDGTDSRRYMGPLPAAGSWVRLEVPANLVGLEGHTVHAMAFSMWGGRATWDRAGKVSPGQWLVTDHLGTPRIVLDQTGSFASVRRHDYLPFGEELFAGTGGRTAAQGYPGGDGVRQQFTGYERDTESGLDFAHARFYSSSQGRFTSVDPLLASVTLVNPQTLNRYSYVTNYPLRLVDPTGMFGIIPVGVDCVGGSIAVENSSSNQQTPPQGTPPPPGGPVSPGPIKIDVGPVPLPEGEEPWPTTLEVVQGDNKRYNGDQVFSPSGEVIDDQPNYGIGRTLDYIIRDQAGNPMSQGVLLTETVSATNAQAQALMGRTEVNKDPIRPDARGIVPDTVGAISRNPSVITFLNENKIDATFSQNLTVYGTVGREYRTALTSQNQYQLTNSGVTMTVGTVQKRARPK